MNKTLFVDIDGSIIQWCGNLTKIIETYPGTLLPGVVEKFNEWAYKGYHIVITTARPESLRDFTIKQLEYHGLFYDQIIFGLPRGPRVVINDVKPATDEHKELITAIAVPLERNKGLTDVNI